MLSGFSGVSRIFGGLDTYLGWAFEFDDTFRGHEWVLGVFGGVETFDHG